MTKAAKSITIDETRYRARVDGQPLALTPKEFELLAVLAKAEGRILSRAFIMRRVCMASDDFVDAVEEMRKKDPAGKGALDWQRIMLERLEHLRQEVDCLRHDNPRVPLTPIEPHGIVLVPKEAS